MLYGRPVPGTSDKILFLGCSHWGPNNGVGTVILLDTKRDTASREAMTLITRDVDARTHGGYTFLVDGKWVNDSTGTLGPLFKDPYPVSENLFLAAQKPKGLPWSDPKGYELCLLDEQGGTTTLYRDEEISCWHPFPVLARSPPPQPAVPMDQELASRKLAQCIVADVYAGLNGVPRGSVKHLRILEQTARPWAARNTWPGDRQAMAHTALGPNLLGLQAQYGIVPVEDDGSANFLVPADRNIYFQVLDEHYLAIQTERTYVNYQPGEHRSCVGCHERARTGATAGLSVSKALKRPPSLPAAQPGEAAGKKVFDYERQIQPIWNAHCVRCHDEKAAVGLNLTGGLTELHNVSYENLLAFGVGKARKTRLPLVGLQVDENDVRAYVEYAPPYFFGAYTSVLAALFGGFEPHFDSFGASAPALAERVKALREKHKEVKLAPEEFIRVANWLDASCQYYPSYWGQKNLQHKQAPYFRPEVTFDEAVGSQWPVALRALYEH
jgi:mono/diheme cytochrome c family protein